MPVGFPSDDQVTVYGQLAGPVSAAEMERFFFLDGVATENGSNRTLVTILR